MPSSTSSGYLPLLVKEGFRGKVWATPATRDLAQILLPDSGHMQEANADFANRHGFSRHAPALPLRTEEDAQRSLKLFHTVLGERSRAAICAEQQRLGQEASGRGG